MFQIAIQPFTELTPKTTTHWRKTISQNHRMVVAGRDLWRPSQVHLEDVTKEYLQAGFECLQKWRLHQPVPELRQA